MCFESRKLSLSIQLGCDDLLRKKQGKKRVQVVHPNVSENDKKKGSIKVYRQTIFRKQC